MAANASRKAKGQPEMEPIEFYSFITPILQKLNMDPVKFLNRNVNEGFSGGEKKRNEILQVKAQSASRGIGTFLCLERDENATVRHSSQNCHLVVLF